MKKSVQIGTLLESPGVLQPELRGQELLRNLLFPRARATYEPASRPWSEDSSQLVHDVRVASRRFVEALDLAKPLLSTKAHLQLRKTARNLRKALGTSREATVMLSHLSDLITRTGTQGKTARLVADLLEEASRKNLRRTREAYPPKRLLEFASAVTKATRSTPAPNLGWAHLGGPHLYRRTIAAMARLPSLKIPEAHSTHHALRVDFKKIRYTFEILSEIYPEVLPDTTHLRDLKTIQEALGELQDADDFIQFLERKELKPLANTSQLDQLKILAQSQAQLRYERARDVVMRIAPDLLGVLRRAAGKIGPLELVEYA